MRVPGLSLNFVAQLFSMLIAIFVADRMLAGYRESQIEAMRRETMRLKQAEADEQEAATMLQAEAVELNVRLTEVNQDIQKLEQRGEAMSLAKSGVAHSRKPREEKMHEVAIARTTRSKQTPPARGAGGSAKNNVGGFQMNQVIDSPPFCRDTTGKKRKKKIKGKLPKFVFVAGVEGSGHHALKDVWWSLEDSGVKLDLVVYDQLFHSFGIENHASYHYSSIKQDSHISAMKEKFENAAKTGAVVIDAQNSYPMGKGAGSLGHPDLMMMSELDGVLFELSVLVLYRDPVNATLSAVRRFQDDSEYLYKNPEFQARVISENLAVINNAMRMLPCNRYMAIRYEDLTTTPEKLVRPIARLLGVKQGVITKAFSKLHPHKPAKADTPEIAAMRRVLKQFFDTQNIMWPLLSGRHTP